MVAGARLFENLFTYLYHRFMVRCFATIGYVCIGGFLAISWTDTFQAGFDDFCYCFFQS
jgi:sodium/proline symporter